MNRSKITKWWVKRPPPTSEELAELKKAELVELAEAQGVDAAGTKAEIVERLADG